MDALWLVGNPLKFFQVPEQQIIIGKQGELFSYANSCEEPVADAREFIALCAQVDILVLVAGSAPLEDAWLALIPAQMPKVGFLLEACSADARLQLTAMGVDAYATLGMSQADFEVVLLKVFDDKKAVNDLQEELKNFSTIAFTAMSSASEMGTVAVFAEKVQEVMELDRLAHLIHACLADLSLSGVVQFMFDDDIRLYPTYVSSSYQRLLQSAQTSSARIVSLGRFLLFSFDHIQLLITDAPVAEEDRYGRLRDVLAHLVSIAEARAKTLKVNSLLKIQQDNARMVMMLLEMSSQDNRNSVKEIMTELSNSLRVIATGFDLNMDQESALLGLSEKALYSLEELQEATQAVEEHFRSLLQQMDNVSLLLQTTESEAVVEEESDSRVELF